VNVLFIIILSFKKAGNVRTAKFKIARDAAVIRISKEGLSNPTPGPWQCNYSRIVSGCNDNSDPNHLLIDRFAVRLRFERT